MAQFFIRRPIFAMVIAIIIVILGAVAIPGLPISAYPQVVPPQVQIVANYLGGNAQDLEKTVAQPIEEQLVGLDGMLYFQATAANNGALTINVTFKLGTNPDIATVQTQNRVNVALPRLPPEVLLFANLEGFPGVTREHVNPVLEHASRSLSDPVPA